MFEIFSFFLKFHLSLTKQYPVISKSNSDKLKFCQSTRCAEQHILRKRRKLLFFIIIKVAAPCLYQSILKLFKVHKVFTPFLSLVDTWNFATSFTLYLAAKHWQNIQKRYFERDFVILHCKFHFYNKKDLLKQKELSDLKAIFCYKISFQYFAWRYLCLKHSISIEFRILFSTF